jgi:HK97 family phage major capsid protein
MAGIDINRTTTGVNLPPAVSSEIWANAQEASAAMQLARQISLPGSGVSVPIITGDAVADWVDETEEKPVSRATFGNKIITPYKLAVIEPFSNEFRRDLPALYAELVRRLPGSLALKFDQTIFDPAVPAPGSNFDKLGGTPNIIDIETDPWAGLVAADQAVALSGGQLSGWALSPQARGVLLGATDTNGRPLFITDLQGDNNVPKLLGAPVYTSKGVYVAAPPPPTLGFAGDWSYALYGTVEGVQVSVSDQATLHDGANTLNLWQRNMFAIRAEIEVGFRVRDIAAFARLTGKTGTTARASEGDDSAPAARKTSTTK